jgi:hypothetical protein
MNALHSATAPLVRERNRAKVVNDNFHHLVAAALHVIQLSIAYVPHLTQPACSSYVPLRSPTLLRTRYALMLVVMTYNIGLTVAVIAGAFTSLHPCRHDHVCISSLVIAGAGAGYFLFARLRRNVVINEAGCH